MKTNVIPKGNIKIDTINNRFVSSVITGEDLETLSRISNGPNGYNISKSFPPELKKYSLVNKAPMLISFYNVGWHDDKKFATKTYPWFAIYVLETNGGDYVLDMGKRGLKESIELKKGDVYLINTQVKHRVRCKSEMKDNPCSILVFNTNIKNA